MLYDSDLVHSALVKKKALLCPAKMTKFVLSSSSTSAIMETFLLFYSKLVALPVPAHIRLLLYFDVMHRFCIVQCLEAGTERGGGPQGGRGEQAAFPPPSLSLSKGEGGEGGRKGRRGGAGRD